MKKYSKPEVEACEIGTDSILAESLGLNDSKGGSQLGNERNNFFGEEEETLSW